jgi:hypothetical protein
MPDVMVECFHRVDGFGERVGVGPDKRNIGEQVFSDLSVTSSSVPKAKPSNAGGLAAARDPARRAARGFALCAKWRATFLETR